MGSGFPWCISNVTQFNSLKMSSLENQIIWSANFNDRLCSGIPSLVLNYTANTCYDGLWMNASEVAGSIDANYSPVEVHS
jgi:hypothetical protein